MRTLKTLEEISDGKLYDIDDYVKADTDNCSGCYTCCHKVDDLVELNPFDVYEIRECLNMSFKELVDNKLILRVNQKIELPYLKMMGQTERCSFLSEIGRCTIHQHRPGICRLFPLGRAYINDDIKYFLQVEGSCVKPNLKEVRVRDWVGIKDYEDNKKFLLTWYQFIKALRFKMKFVYDEAELEAMNQYVKDTLYDMPVNEKEDFYSAFYKLLPEAKKHLGIL